MSLPRRARAVLGVLGFLESCRGVRLKTAVRGIPERTSVATLLNALHPAASFAISGVAHVARRTKASPPAIAFGAVAAAKAARIRAPVRLASTATQPSAKGVDFGRGMGATAAAFVRDDMEVVMVPCLGDNYAPIFHCSSTGATAVIDTPEAGPIFGAIESRGWTLTHVLNTHHHIDHTGGNRQLKQLTDCFIIGPKDEARRIPCMDRGVGDGEHLQVGAFDCVVLGVGGHTKGHIAYYFPKQNVVFVGDTLFNLGCGRIFEGTPHQMWESLSKLLALPDETVVYCAHEYTEANARFAMHVGGVPKLAERVAIIKDMRQRGEATVPMLLGHEKETNPFLRAATDEMREAVGLPPGTPAVDVFAEVRRRKDVF